jgi:hypothetical protein
MELVTVKAIRQPLRVSVGGQLGHLGQTLLATKVECGMNGRRVYLLGGGELIVPLEQPFEILPEEIPSLRLVPREEERNICMEGLSA